MLLLGGRRMRRALEHMHERGLVHADVKSGNCMISSSGAWYLGDFGSSLGIGEKIWSCTEVIHTY